MTNSIALILGMVLAACVAADAFLNDGMVLLFLARKFLELIEWIAFWR